MSPETITQYIQHDLSGKEIVVYPNKTGEGKEVEVLNLKLTPPQIEMELDETISGLGSKP